MGSCQADMSKPSSAAASPAIKPADGVTQLASFDGFPGQPMMVGQTQYMPGQTFSQPGGQMQAVESYRLVPQPPKTEYQTIQKKVPKTVMQMKQEVVMQTQTREVPKVAYDARTVMVPKSVMEDYTVDQIKMVAISIPSRCSARSGSRSPASSRSRAP